METFFKNKNLFEFIWKWKWVYVIVTLIAIIASVIFSGKTFIRPKFKSFAIVYPSNLQEYSEESKTEQMLQIFESEQLKLKLINTFNLYHHYNIDTNYKYAQTAVLKELNENVSISKTQYESVKIEVMDYYTDTAKMMVDSILSFYNQIVREMQNKKYMEIIKIDEREMQKLEIERDSLTKIISKYRKKYNLYNPKLQIKEITKSYLNSKNNQTNGIYKNILEHSDEIILLDSLLEFNKSSYVGYKYNYKENLKNIEKKISYANVVSSPIIADKKSYPVRWLILTLTVLATFLFTFITLMVYESVHKKS